MSCIDAVIKTITPTNVSVCYTRVVWKLHGGAVVKD